MKRTLLDASLVVFGAALFVRLAVAFAPHGFHLPRMLREDSNGAMVVSAALALSLGLSILLPRIRLPRIADAKFVIAAIAILFVIAVIVARLSLDPRSPMSATQVTWDDENK